MDISSHGVPSLAKRFAWRQCRALAIIKAHALCIKARLPAGLCIDAGEHERMSARQHEHVTPGRGAHARDISTSTRREREARACWRADKFAPSLQIFLHYRLTPIWGMVIVFSGKRNRATP
jgi:hypothetical protein